MTGERTPDPGGDGRAAPTSSVPLPTPSALDDLRRWQDSGGQRRVLVRTPGNLQIALLTCSAGEEMTRLVTRNPEVLEFIGERWSGQDGPASMMVGNPHP
jgi:hypothetical protein